jgi:hypothetical protein
VEGIYALTEAGAAGPPRRAKPGRQAKGETSRAGAYWIACMVADMMGGARPNPDAFGFAAEPAQPAWWDAATGVKAGMSDAEAATTMLADALATLGLPPDATLEQAKRAYRRLALRHHPDCGGDAELFKAATAAIEVVRLALEAGANAL